MTRRRALLAGLVVLIVLPLAVVVRTGWQPLTRADRRADDDAHALVVGTGWLLHVARGGTHLGDPAVVTALAVVAALACWIVGRRTDAIYLVGVRIVAVVVGFGLKESVARARPSLPQPVAHANGYSFPSGHALGASALYLSLALVSVRIWRGRGPRWTLLALGVVVPCAVATTRVLLGVHFPSDVVAGLVLGWAIALLGRSVEPEEPSGRLV